MSQADIPMKTLLYGVIGVLLILAIVLIIKGGFFRSITAKIASLVQAGFVV